MAMSSEQRRMRLDRFREAARLRDMPFQEEQLGSLARFYQENAAEYLKKAEEYRKQYEEMQPYWEDVFTQASMAYQVNEAAKRKREIEKTSRQLGSNYSEYLRNQWGRRYSEPRLTQSEWEAQRGRISQELYDADKAMQQLPGYGSQRFVEIDRQNRMFGTQRGIRDLQGRFINLSDVLTETGERKDISQIRGAKARRYAEVKTPYEDYAGQAATYQSQFEAEVASLAQRNEERRQQFLAEKQQRLSSLQNVQGSYRGATYTEKPL